MRLLNHEEIEAEMKKTQLLIELSFRIRCI